MKTDTQNIELINVATCPSRECRGKVFSFKLFIIHYEKVIT